jgi:long-chain acyl-CoA synthetase
MVPHLLEEPDRPEFPTLQCVSPAGEAVTPERKEQMAVIFGCAIRESYGLAECTWPLGQLPEAPQQKLFNRTGTQSPSVSISVVGDQGPLGSDEIGELLLGGPTLFPGYLGNPEITASVIAEDGWFQTGDLAYFDDDGYYAICGRQKDVIKRSGAQVIPQEIEDALSAHPNVKEVAVVGLPDDRRGEIACACVVLELGATVTADDLLEFLDGKLATYKLPERIEMFEQLPISNNGKVLKNELRDGLVAE